MWSARARTTSNPYVVAQAMDGGRRFEIAATWPAYQAAQSTHEKLSLPLETGRDGIQRVLLPRRGSRQPI